MKYAGADLYTIWDTDTNGNYVSSPIGAVSGSSTALEALEPSFHQDLNGDGSIGVPSITIEAQGSTSLVQVGSNYFLDSISSGTGPELQLGGANFAAGQLGPWTPIGAEQTSTGYEVALKYAGADLYTIWDTDTNGNYVSSPIGAVSGSSTALEALEPSFHQDLNGDGSIGVPSITIEAQGSTSLVQVGSNYFLDSISSGTGPELQLGGANFAAGQLGPWTPIGAEQTSTGYEVALKYAGADLYTIWDTDTNGNYVSSPIGAVSGSSTALEALEPSFHQDLNGDGSIGVPSMTIEAQGSTSLVQVGSNYFLDSISSGTGPELQLGGANFVAGQLGPWTPIGAEQTSTGYEVALKYAGADLYTIWDTDTNGNYVSSPIGAVSGSSTALEALEPSFHQDLNGDGTIGIKTVTVQNNQSFVFASVAAPGGATDFAAGAEVFGHQPSALWNEVLAQGPFHGHEIGFAGHEGSGLTAAQMAELHDSHFFIR